LALAKEVLSALAVVACCFWKLGGDACCSFSAVRSAGLAVC
jgi:hypothetical protein